MQTTRMTNKWMVNQMITQDREYRAFSFDLSDEMRATGKPVVFNSPTVMYESDGVQYYEQIDASAFEGADMSDVVLNIDHAGKPAAKTKNGTLSLEIRSDGLYMNADLSKNATGRELYEDIKNGFYDKMSFAFTVAKESYNKKLRTRVIEKIDRLFDVSAVTFPAYSQTAISARSFFEAEAEKEKVAEAIEREKRNKLAEISRRIDEVLNG